MSHKKTGNDEITFEFEPTPEQVQGMTDLGMTEKDISECIQHLLKFLYTYNPSVLSKIKARAGKPDKIIENKLLKIAAFNLKGGDPEKTHKLAGLLLGVFFALVNEIEQYKKGDKK